MDSSEPRFSLAELEESSGLNERTIRYYIAQGLMPAAMGRGRSRYYTPEHLQILEQIAALREQRLSIDEIRGRLEQSAAPPELDSDRWQRVRLSPDLELHIREDAPTGIRELAARITALSASWFGENDEHE